MQKINSGGMKTTLLNNLFFNFCISYDGYSGQGQISASEVLKIDRKVGVVYQDAWK